MSVSINIIRRTQSENCPEYHAAIALKSLLENSFTDNDNGEINIAYSLTLCGEEVRDVDLFVFGKLQNYILRKYHTNNPQFEKKDLVIDDFCIAIELKEHPIDRVDYHATHILVEYQGYWKDATEQNEKQRYACASYLKKAISKDVFCANFVWLKSVTKEQLQNKTQYALVGALPSSFTFKDMISIIKAQGLTPFFDTNDKCYHITSNRNENVIDDIKKSLFSRRPSLGGLTRQRLESIIQSKTEVGLKELGIGDKLVIFKGKAGTGKTFRLIQSAMHLANANNGNRCLLLTYNHALVSDIRRLLHFMEIPDGIDNYTIQIQTLHSFFLKLMDLLGIDVPRLNTAFEYQYSNAITDLLEHVKILLDDKELAILKDEHKLAIDWDYILIDEAQDWSEAEKEILFKVYGPNRIIVADGVDQFMRKNNRLQWTSESKNVRELTSSMRQRRNLVSFANILAGELGLQWKIKPNDNDQWCGGRVYIRKHYTKQLHDILKERCKVAKCENYDMLYLIPHQMKPSNPDNEMQGIRKIDFNKWEEKVGVTFFDGTEYNQRISYSTDVEQCRLYQYESCRGLEGWVVVCLNLDVLVENKLKEFGTMSFDTSLELCRKEEALKSYVYKWCLMPLTRPIDTLVITLNDFNSEIAQALKRVAEKCKDYVDWKQDE